MDLDIFKKTGKVKITCLLLIVLGVVVRLFFFDYIYCDYKFFLNEWVEYIRNNGYAYSLKDSFYNYTPSYIYILILLAKIDVYSLYSIKVVSLLFDFLAAYFISALVYLVSKNNTARWISFTLATLLPTVILNGALWSQCDSIYSSFAIGSVFFLLKRKNVMSMIFLGIAFAFKAQASVLLPFFFIYMIRGGIKWYYFFIIPTVYVFSLLPAWIMGRPLADLILVYQMQSNFDNALVSFFPNIYIWIENFIPANKIYGMFFTAIFVLSMGFILMQKKYIFTLESWVKLIFLSCIICPFVLPGMRERYMYLGDLIAVAYICLYPRKAYLAVGILFVSFYSYIRTLNYFGVFLGDNNVNPLKVLSFFNLIPWKAVSLLYLGIIMLIVTDFVKSLRTNVVEKEF